MSSHPHAELLREKDTATLRISRDFSRDFPGPVSISRRH